LRKSRLAIMSAWLMRMRINNHGRAENHVEKCGAASSFRSDHEVFWNVLTRPCASARRWRVHVFDFMRSNQSSKIRSGNMSRLFFMVFARMLWLAQPANGVWLTDDVPSEFIGFPTTDQNSR